VPSIVARARRLYYLLARLVPPLTVYEPIAAGTRALQPNVVVQQVRDAPSSFFQGAKWKAVYETDWPTIRGALTALYDHGPLRAPKYWDMLARIEEARKTTEKLVIRCATRAESQALAAALIADGWLDAEELGEDRLVDIRWFGTASPALHTGSAKRPITTLLTEPPSPFAGAAYLSAEAGMVEAILYPAQMPRFERLARNAWRNATGSMNDAVIGLFCDGQLLCDDTPVLEPTFEELPPFTLIGRGETKTRAETKEIITMDSFFAQLAGIDENDDSRCGARASGRSLCLDRVPRG